MVMECSRAVPATNISAVIVARGTIFISRRRRPMGELTAREVMERLRPWMNEMRRIAFPLPYEIHTKIWKAFDALDAEIGKEKDPHDEPIDLDNIDPLPSRNIEIKKERSCETCDYGPVCKVQRAWECVRDSGCVEYILWKPRNRYTEQCPSCGGRIKVKGD